MLRQEGAATAATTAAAVDHRGPCRVPYPGLWTGRGLREPLTLAPHSTLCGTILGGGSVCDSHRMPGCVHVVGGQHPVEAGRDGGGWGP